MMRTRWWCTSRAASVGVGLLLLAPHLLLPAAAQSAPPECLFEGEDEYCYDGVCQGAATCVGYQPEVEPEKCLTGYGESGAKIVGNYTITLEHHNWLSASLLTQVVAILMTDILGYKVRKLDITGNAGSAARLALGRADANVEYWEDNNESEWSPIVAKGLIQMQKNNFPGQENLFISSKEPIKGDAIWWDYYRTYSGNTTGPAMELLPVSERPAGVPGPREHVTLDGTVLHASDITEPCADGHQLAQDGCNLDTMQWYPKGNEFCQPDPDTLQTSCHEIYGHSMGWSYGKIEGLITKHNIPGTLVHWGANFTKVLLDQVERGRKVIHYWWTPDPFIPRVQKQGYTISEIMWPPFRSSCTQYDGCGYKSSVISKVVGARLSSVELLEPAADLIKDFSPDLTAVERLLGYHVDGGGTSDTAWGAACEFLRNNERYVTMAVQKRDDLARLCVPGQVAVEGQLGECRDCPAGSFSDSSAATECELCPAGTFAKEKSNQCTGCPPGHYSAPGSAECFRCAPGTFAETANSTCTPCPGGSFASSDASSTCKPCPLDTYTVADGSAECTACPEHTTTVDVGSTSADACLCVAGSYARLAAPVPGEPADCAVCPDGTVCGGNFTVPVPAPGYWMTRITPELRGRRDVVPIECPDGACNGGCSGPEAAAVAAELSAVALRNVSAVGCRKDPAQACSDGYEGRLCFQCSTYSHYGLGPECNACPAEHKTLKTGLMIFAVVVIWIVINRVLTSDYNAMDISLIYLQLVSVVTAFSLPWPGSKVWKSIVTVISITQFDVDFVTPSCFVPVTPMSGYMFQLVFPVIIAALYTVQYYVSRWLLRSGIMAKFGPKTQLVLGYFGMSVDEEELGSSWDQVVSNSLSMLNVTYLSITVKNLQQFMCRAESDDVSFVSGMPTVVCGSDEHRLGVALAVVGLVVYTFGFPVYLTYILAKGRMNNKLHEASYLARYGFMYMRYESEYWYGELLLILRRFLFSISLVAFSNDAVWQPASATVSLFFAYGLHTYLQPFYEERIDFLEKVAMMSLAVLLVCGMLLQSVDSNSAYAQTIEVLAILTIVIELAIASVITYLDEEDVRVRASFGSLFYDEDEEEGEAQSPHSPHAPHVPSSNEIKMARQATKKPGRFKMIARNSTFVKKVSRNSSRIFTQMMQRRPEELEMTRSLTADAIRAYLNIAKGKQGEEYKKFLDAIRHLEDAMADVVSDESLTSDYSVHPAAQLYRALLNGEAYFLIDYLLSLPPDSQIVHSWRVCIEDLERFFVRYIKGSEQAKYTTVMENHDLPSILRWAMLKSDTESREHFRLLVDTLFKEMKDNPTRWGVLKNKIDEAVDEVARSLEERGVIKRRVRPVARSIIVARSLSQFTAPQPQRDAGGHFVNPFSPRGTDLSLNLEGQLPVQIQVSPKSSERNGQAYLADVAGEMPSVRVGAPVGKSNVRQK